MNVDKTPIDNKVRRVECDSPSLLLSPVKLGQVLTSKQSDPAIKRCKMGGKACKGGKIRGRSHISVRVALDISYFGWDRTLFPIFFLFLFSKNFFLIVISLSFI